MLIAEDLLLLLTRDDTGQPVAGSQTLAFGLAGGVLVELALAGRVDIAAAGDRVKEGRVVIRDPSPTGDELLDEALAALCQREGKKPQQVIGTLQRGLRDKIYARLADRGLVRRKSRKVLGLFPHTSWPAADAAHEEQIRGAITSALARNDAADARVGALIGLLSAMNAVTTVIDPAAVGVSKGDLKRRAQTVAEQSWAPGAVRKAIQAAQAATNAAVASAAIVSMGSS
jgi:Golgi phosphoprotein 3 (GPP34)